MVKEEMTTISYAAQDRVVLNFSNEKYSKNHIKQAIRKCEIVNLEPRKGTKEFIAYCNIIIIGMYAIVLELPLDSCTNWHHLRDYNDFQISICDSSDHKSRINLEKDSRFKNQYWVPNNFFGKLRVKHLIDIIHHCVRLNRLKAFL